MPCSCDAELDKISRQTVFPRLMLGKDVRDIHLETNVHLVFLNRINSLTADRICIYGIQLFVKCWQSKDHLWRCCLRVWTKTKCLLNLISLFGVMLLHIITLWIVLSFIEEERGEQKNWPQLGEINWTTSYVWLILCLFCCPSWFIWVVKQIWWWSDFFYHTIDYKYQWWACWLRISCSGPARLYHFIIITVS